MSTQIKHDSRSTLYRLPGGAMPAGSGVRIRLWASRAFKQVFLRVNKRYPGARWARMTVA